MHRTGITLVDLENPWKLVNEGVFLQEDVGTNVGIPVTQRSGSTNYEHLSLSTTWVYGILFRALKCN